MFTSCQDAILSVRVSAGFFYRKTKKNHPFPIRGTDGLVFKACQKLAGLEDWKRVFR
jgi:hypothetical protein